MQLFKAVAHARIEIVVGEDALLEDILAVTHLHCLLPNVQVI